MSLEVITRIMYEHVQVPGLPQVIVTREFLYGWLVKLGWDRRERGFGSIDYYTFHRSAVDEPLTEESARDRLLGFIEESSTGRVNEFILDHF